MKILAVISGEYGRRHVDNIRRRGPADWEVSVWQAPAVLPPMMDYPEDYVPKTLPPADLILSFAENKGVAELLPELARLTGATAVIAGVDSEAWLPRGLARQLRGWLADMGVVGVTPKPLCSLTERDYGVARRKREPYNHPVIAEFARHFGQPSLHVTVDPDSRTIIAVAGERDAVCGCAGHAAQGLIGVLVDEAEYQAGMLHHHYPCLASMGVDSDFGDTLMHISGNTLKDDVAEKIRKYKKVQYVAPGQKSSPE